MIIVAAPHDAAARNATSRICRDSRCRPRANRGCACQRAAVLDNDAAPTVDLSCATSPTGCRTEVREVKTSPFFADGAGCLQKKFRKYGIALRGVTIKLFLHTQVWW